MADIKPVRLQLSRRGGFNLQDLSLVTNGLPAVNVARPSAWGNPFIVGKHGTRGECVHLYKMLMAGYFAVSKVNVVAQKSALHYVGAHFEELTGRNLACWCRLDGKPCHADVLLELANG